MFYIGMKKSMISIFSYPYKSTNKFYHISIPFCTQAFIYVNIISACDRVILYVLKNISQNIKIKDVILTVQINMSKDNKGQISKGKNAMWQHQIPC